jgi:hypothetical protein
MRIGIIGAGQVGTTLGRAWASAGHEIIYGARENSGAAPHAGARLDSVRGAATAGDVVALVTPWAAVPDALRAAGDLGGKPLIDVTNPIGPGFVLTHGHTSSGAEEVARLATNARVVKAFNSTGRETMARPVFGGRRAVMPVAADDAAAVEVAVKLASDIGFEGVGLKGLVRARELEPLALFWIKLALQFGLGRDIAFGIARRTANEPALAATASSRRRIITVVGSGNIGGALARAWLRAGHDVRIATRDASSKEVADLVALGALAVPVSGAANGAEVVVFAIPAFAVVDAARSLGSLEGKIVIDCTNAIGKGFTLQYGHTTSSSEEIAKSLPGARVVRAFNQQGAETLRDPRFGGLAATSFVAADDDEARHVVLDLTRDVGLDAVEAGPLSSARLLEPMTLLWIALAQAIGTRDFGLSLLR